MKEDNILLECRFKVGDIVRHIIPDNIDDLIESAGAKNHGEGYEFKIARIESEFAPIGRNHKTFICWPAQGSGFFDYELERVGTDFSF